MEVLTLFKDINNDTKNQYDELIKNEKDLYKRAELIKERSEMMRIHLNGQRNCLNTVIHGQEEQEQMKMQLEEMSMLDRLDAGPVTRRKVMTHIKQSINGRVETDSKLNPSIQKECSIQRCNNTFYFNASQIGLRGAKCKKCGTFNLNPFYKSFFQ